MVLATCIVAAIVGYRIIRLSRESKLLKSVVECKDRDNYVLLRTEPSPPSLKRHLQNSWLKGKLPNWMQNDSPKTVDGLSVSGSRSAKSILALTYPLHSVRGLTSSEELNPQVLRMLDDLPHLEYLHVKETQNAQPLIDYLLRTPKITRIAITDSKCTHQQALQFRKAKWLKWLVLSGENLSARTLSELRSELKDTFVYIEKSNSKDYD